MAKVGEAHKLVFDKWQSLANYAAGPLLSTKLVLVAKLDLVSIDDEQQFKLSAIKLAKKETYFDINLLHPSFEYKYICNPQCIQLTEFLSNDKNFGNTLLDNYFSKHEFELFKFYGAIALLNDRFLAMQQANPNRVSVYLDWLVKQDKEFATVKEFSQYLVQAVSDEGFLTFINEPLNFYASLAQEREDDQLQQYSAEDVIENERQHWYSGSTPDQLLVMQPPPFILPSELSSGSFNIGDTVCSFNDNKVGVISEIRGRNIQVQLVGQIQSLVDGQTLAANMGDIFNSEITPYFSSINENKVFTEQEIALCNFKP
jgi:hypothetical protein